MSEVNNAQLRQDFQSFVQVYKEISSTTVIEIESGRIFEEENIRVQAHVDLEFFGQ